MDIKLNLTNSGNRELVLNHSERPEGPQWIGFEGDLAYMTKIFQKSKTAWTSYQSEKKKKFVFLTRTLFKQDMHFSGSREALHVPTIPEQRSYQKSSQSAHERGLV